MRLIEIDWQTCTLCGLCARACPAGIIIAAEDFPETVEKIEKSCTTCGHCVAACPSAALSHCRMAPSDCLELAADWRSPVEKMEQGAKGMLKAWERGEDPILRNAPHLIIAHGIANDSAANYSSIIALTTLELAALSFGLGACWAGFLFQAANQYKELYDALNLPPGHLLYGGLMLGYPEFEYVRIPTRRTATVTWR